MNDHVLDTRADPLEPEIDRRDTGIRIALTVLFSIVHGVLIDTVREDDDGPFEHLGPTLETERRPCGLGRPRAIDRSLDLAGRRDGNLADDVAGRGVQRRKHDHDGEASRGGGSNGRLGAKMPKRRI